MLHYQAATHERENAQHHEIILIRDHRIKHRIAKGVTNLISFLTRREVEMLD